MFGVSPTCETQLNGYKNYTHLDFLDSFGSPESKSEETLEKSATPPPPASALDDSTTEEVPSMTLTITNVVSMANMRCHLRLKEIAKKSVNVEYKALQNHVIMRLRKPYTVATIWSSGKIWCTGANSLAKARQGARRIARRLSHVGFPCRFSNYRIVNIMATCRLPFRVRLDSLLNENRQMMSYEPELAPGLNFKAEKNSSTSLKLFSTGRIVIMGSSMASIGSLVEDLVPLAALHQTDEPISDPEDEPEGNGSTSASRSRSRSARHQRYASATRAKEAKAASRPFAEMVAADIPALADVLLEDADGLLEDAYDAAAVFDAFEDEADAVGTDNDSEEDADDTEDDHLNTRLIRMPAPLNSSNFAPAPKPVMNSWMTGGGAHVNTDKLNLVGASGLSSSKRACITAYSDQSPHHETVSTTTSAITTSVSIPIVSRSQQHIIIQQQPVQTLSTTYSTIPQQQPTFSNASQHPGNVIPIQFNNHVSPYMQSVSGAAASPNNQTVARIVSVNPSGQTNIVRIVNPIQLSQPHQQLQTIIPQQLQHVQGQQQQHIILNRFPMQTAVINPQFPGGYSIINPQTVQFQQVQPNQINPTTSGNCTTATIINPQQFTNFVYR